MNDENSLPAQFANKIALITGSGRGIGKAIALHFARRGADVVINFFRNRAPAEETARVVEALGRRALLIKADIGSLDELTHLFDETGKAFGGLDFYIHNAASGYNRPAMEQKPKGWDWTMNINARSLLFGAQKAASLMEKRGGGAIVSISSAGSTRVLPDYVVVGASKAALEALTRYLGVELISKISSSTPFPPALSRRMRSPISQAWKARKTSCNDLSNSSPPGGWWRPKTWLK